MLILSNYTTTNSKVKIYFKNNPLYNFFIILSKFKIKIFKIDFRRINIENNLILKLASKNNTILKKNKTEEIMIYRVYKEIDKIFIPSIYLNLIKKNNNDDIRLIIAHNDNVVLDITNIEDLELKYDLKNLKNKNFFYQVYLVLKNMINKYFKF